MPPTDHRETDDFLLHAWVDESIQMPRPGRPGRYLLAATIADPESCGTLRDSLRDLVGTRGGRLHWYHESPAHRRKIASTIGAQDVAHTVVVASPIDLRRQERARRQCIERLLYSLEATGVTRVWFEKRTEILNRRDRAMVDALRGKNVISADLRVEFIDPADEPMVWIPDAVAGIVGRERNGIDIDLRLVLGSGIDILEIDLS